MSQPRPAGHRAPSGRRRWPGAIALVVLVGLVAGAAAFFLRDPGDRPGGGSDVQAGDQDAACGERRFSIAADPRVVAAVRQVVAGLPEDSCISVGVRSAPSATIAADVARAEGKGLGGTLPDAWIPDSSLWLGIAGASDEGEQRLDGAGTSLAGTPVVLATTPDRATELGWPDATDWGAVLEPESPVTLALPALDRDGATLTGLPALQGTRSLVELSRLVAAPPLTDGEPLDLLLSGAAQMVPTTEQEVVAAAATDEPVVALYDEAFGALDFPLVRVRALDAEDDPAVDDLFDGVAAALTGAAGQRALGAAGFRSPDGEAPSATAEIDGVNAGAPMGTPVADAPGIDEARTGWATQGRRARLLMVMDLSGSMGERLPDGRTRAEAAQDALRGLVEGASPDDALGLWGFTTLIGNGDYEILLPAQQLDATTDGVSLRSQFLTEVDQLAPVPGGSTSLYDTVAAAYATATDRYVDGRFNAVVVVTDGRNEDPGSRTLPGLLDDVRRRFDGTRPVRIVTVAYGEDADVVTLEQIADATGGRSYRALTGDQVQARLSQLLAAD